MIFRCATQDTLECNLIIVDQCSNCSNLYDGPKCKHAWTNIHQWGNEKLCDSCLVITTGAKTTYEHLRESYVPSKYKFKNKKLAR